MKDPTLTIAVAVYKALAHPSRLRILAMLRAGELCVCQITAVLEAAPSTASAHLAELRRAGLLTERKEGRWVYYSLADDETARRRLAGVWETVAADPRLAADARLLARLRCVPVEEVCRMGLDLEKLGLAAPATSPTEGGTAS
jgi:DNA-binding transcriptional ArsR family regulator